MSSGERLSSAPPGPASATAEMLGNEAVAGTLATGASSAPAQGVREGEGGGQASGPAGGTDVVEAGGGVGRVEPGPGVGSASRSNAEPPGASVPPRRAMLPPPPAHRAQIWGALLLGLLLLLPPLLVGLGGAETTDRAEQVTLAASRMTWQGGGGWLIPQWNNSPQVGQPPLPVWMTLLAWQPLDRGSADASTLVHRARLVAGVFVLLMLAATFWAGMSIGGIRTAMMSMLAGGTCVLLAWEGRWASHVTYLAGWTTLAVASGLWAIRPLKDSSGLDRRVAGWLIAGLAIGGAMLSARPATALGLAALPLALMILIVPRRRLGNLLGLVFALGVGVLVITPWIMFVVGQAEQLNLSRPLGTIFAGPPASGLAETAGRGLWRPTSIGWLLLWVAPWVIWLAGGLFQPWLRGEGDRRRQLLIAWVWFVALLPVLWLAGATPRYLLVPILPAAALLIGQLWAYHIRLADRSVIDPGTNLLRLPHWVFMVAASAALPIYALFQPRIATLVNRWLAGEGERLLRPVEWPGLHPAAILVAGVVLLALAVMGVVWHYRWRPRWAFAATAVWAVVVLTLMQYSAARSYRASNPYRADALQVAARVGSAPLFRLAAEAEANPPLTPAFLFYSGRSVAVASADQLDEAQPSDEPLYVACAAAPAQAATLEALGFERLLEFQDGAAPRRLYRRPARHD